MTPDEWLLARLDDPPQVFLLRDRGCGPWRIVLQIDGGYADRDDAVRVAGQLGREVRWLHTGAKERARKG